MDSDRPCVCSDFILIEIVWGNLDGSRCGSISRRCRKECTLAVELPGKQILAADIGQRDTLVGWIELLIGDAVKEGQVIRQAPQRWCSKRVDLGAEILYPVIMVITAPLVKTNPDSPCVGIEDVVSVSIAFHPALHDCRG